MVGGEWSVLTDHSLRHTSPSPPPTYVSEVRHTSPSPPPTYVSEVGGGEGDVCLTVTETWKGWVGGREGAPGVTEVRGDAEFVSPQQTKEGTLHVCFDGVGEGSVRVGETDMEQLVVEGVDGERERRQ